MKKHLPGFVPVKFKKLGIALLIIGLACFLVKLLSYLTDWFNASNYFIFFGASLTLISLYLIFATPKE